MRMVAPVVAAAAILAEGLVVAGLLFVLGGVVDAYSMSLDGADPGHARTALRIAALVIGALLVALAVRLLLVAARQRAVRRWAVVALVVQSVVVTISGIALGWGVFLGTLIVLGTLFYVLLDDGATG